MPQARERFREITDHGVIPAPSGAGALLLHAEEGLDCLLVLGVFRPADKAQLTAIVTFEQCMQSVFGYPNDEAYWHDPRGPAGDPPGYGFFEVLDSTWPGRLITYNRHAFPDRTPSHYATLPLLHRLPRRLRRVPRPGHEDRADQQQLRTGRPRGTAAGRRPHRRMVTRRNPRVRRCQKGGTPIKTR